jgi:hypothetical protein
MHNPLKPDAFVTLGTKKYRLNYEYRDFAEAEGRLKIPLLPGSPQGNEFWMNSLAAYQLAVLTFVGVCRHDPALTLDQMYGHITYDNMAEIESTVMPAAMDAISPLTVKGGKSEGKEAEAPLPPPSTGNDSGHSPSSASE